jgi:hypothetical protein
VTGLLATPSASADEVTVSGGRPVTLEPPAVGKKELPQGRGIDLPWTAAPRHDGIIICNPAEESASP